MPTVPTSGSVVLKRGRDRSVRRRHPWIFSGAIACTDGDPGAGDTVIVRSSDGVALGRGAYSPTSQIAVRLWTFDPDRPVDEQFFRDRLRAAGEARTPRIVRGAAQGMRLVHAESDFLPGLVVDRYADHLVCQCLSAGIEVWRDRIVSLLDELYQPAGIYERSDVEVRTKEGLSARAGPLAGEPPPEWVEILEHGCRYAVDIRRGHKTGFYLDQADNRAVLARLAANRRVLNCFAYTGAFGIAALSGGASEVTNVETSADARAVAEQQARLNDIESDRMEWVTGDVFTVLRDFRDRGRDFDLIVLDPPKFADARTAVSRAARGYKDINLLALKLLTPGGLLMTFSCSGVVSPELFQKIVADAALDAGRTARILHTLTQASDHPVATGFPEGRYLKGLVVTVE